MKGYIAIIIAYTREKNKFFSEFLRENGKLTLHLIAFREKKLYNSENEFFFEVHYDWH